MRCIVYISMETRRLRREDIAEILRVSRMKNTLRGITGELMYYDGLFLQVLEGEAAQLDELLATLRQDRRHREVRVLLDETIGERHFADWSMGLVDFADLAPEDRWLVHSLDRPLPGLKSHELADRLRRLVGSFQAMVERERSGTP